VTAVDTKAPDEVRKFSLTTLTAMVVGSLVGAGVILLANRFIDLVLVRTHRREPSLTLTRLQRGWFTLVWMRKREYL
jgi:hypothetical protein